LVSHKPAATFVMGGPLKSIILITGICSIFFNIKIKQSGNLKINFYFAGSAKQKNKNPV